MYLWHTGHRVAVTSVDGPMTYVKWTDQLVGNDRMPIATGLLASVQPLSANARLDRQEEAR